MLELKLLASCIFDPFSRKTNYLFKYGHIMLGNKTNLRYLYLTYNVNLNKSFVRQFNFLCSSDC